MANGYVLITETDVPSASMTSSSASADNPQYAYARKLGQLRPLRLTRSRNLFERYTDAQIKRGVRLGDMKPAVLRNERDWLDRLGCQLMKIALISPKGPLYRHRGGIFKRSLRYQPLTLTTLAALVPPESTRRSRSTTKAFRTSR